MEMLLKILLGLRITSSPASLRTILLYLAFLAETKAYVSIINYLSAVWSLHKLNGIQHIEPSTFAIQMTLRGIHICKQAAPLRVEDLKLIFTHLDMDNSEDVAFWLAIILCFRGLLRKSNMVQKDLAVCLLDVMMFPWGLLLSVRRTKTISFRERVLSIPFHRMTGSIFCVFLFYILLLSLVTYPSRESQLISYMRNGSWVRGSFRWFSLKLTGISNMLSLSGVSTHSLRRGGASAMGDADFTLLQI